MVKTKISVNKTFKKIETMYLSSHHALERDSHVCHNFKECSTFGNKLCGNLVVTLIL